MIKRTQIVLITALFGLVLYLLWVPMNENILKDKITSAFELANPGSQVTEISLIRDGSVYKAIFRLGGKLNEVYIDPRGKYLFPIRSDISETVIVFENQKNFFTCLAEKNTVLFGVVGSNYTTAQLQALGSGPYVGLIYADCGGKNQELCISKNITNAPSWVIDNKYYPTSLSPTQVAQLSNCTISG